MSVLRRKVLRDLGRMKGQAVAVGAVVAIGVASLVAMWSMYDYLLGSRDAYYRTYRFAEVFASLERAPGSLARRVRELPGVGRVQARVVHDVVLDVPDLDEPASGRTISLPADRRPTLNGVHLRRGRFPAPRARGEAVASEGFAEANGLGPGDTLSAVMNGRWQQIRIVGIGISPEYVYEFRGDQILPDRRRFGILWMDGEVLESAFDMEGAFNDLSLTLGPGARPEAVIERVDRLLAPYGGVGAHGREDQLSHRFLSDEIAQNRISSTVIPAIFLGVAAFLLHVVLGRMVSTQRGQIGVLKAFGRSDAAVAAHYLQLGLAPVLAGAAVGVALGSWLAVELAGIYADFYRFPTVSYDPRVDVALVAVAVSAGAASLGALGAVRRALALPPAEAMRPETPPEFRPALAEKTGLGRLLGVEGRMVLRNLERRPGKAILTVVGIAMAAGVCVLGRFTFDAVDRLQTLQFREAERQDVTVTFGRPEPAAAARALATLPGVLRVEPFRAVPAELGHGHRSHRVGLTGLPADGELRRIVDAEAGAHPLPPDGLLLTDWLARKLGVEPGDEVTARVLVEERPVLRLPVHATVEELLGMSAYLRLDALHRHLGEEGTVSGARLSVDPAEAAGLYGRLKRTPAVTGVGVRSAALRTFEETFEETFAVATTVLVLFAAVIAFGIVYNNARVALSERARELASLRVLGYGRAQVSRMLLSEQATLLLVGIPAGLGLGWLFSRLLVTAYRTDLFRLPLVVSRDTLLFAAGTVLASAVVSGIVVDRRIRGLDLVEALKTREE